VNVATKQARSIIGDDTDGGRPEHDFYPTPRGGTLALLSVEAFPTLVWEPACGNGAISRVLQERGHKVISEDLIYRSYGVGGRNFLTNRIPKADAIVTNPPFTLAEEFIKVAYGLGVGKFAYLMKLAALEGISRSYLLQRTGLARLWVFRNRILMTRNGEDPHGSGMIAFAWFVWDRTHSGPAEIGWVQEVTEQAERQAALPW
jgi:hypothetical protein